MANNAEVQSGSGIVVATDDIAGVHYQKFKLAFGGEDTATAVEAGVGLPVAIVGTPAVTVAGSATAANQATAIAHLLTLIGHLDGAETLLTAIQTSVQLLDDAIAGTEMQVDVVGSLPAGANAIGKLAANSGVDIGDVTVNNTEAAPVFTQHNHTGLADGNKTVASAGTAEALAGSTTCKRVVVQARHDNTGLIAVGAAGVTTAADGIILYAGDSLTLAIDNLADVFVDASVTGEGVRFIYYT